MQDPLAMRAAASLAAAFGSLEPDHCRELRPINRIKPPVFWPNRHQSSLPGLVESGAFLLKIMDQGSKPQDHDQLSILPKRKRFAHIMIEVCFR
jgi:hypothetical protein